MSPAVKTLVFDLDGTLVDSARDLVPALNKTTALDGLPSISQEQAGYYVGQGTLKMIERSFELHNMPLSAKRHKELSKIFLTHYEANIAKHTRFYEGSLAAISDLSAVGWSFAVCTNKFEYLAREVLEQLGQANLFSAVTGGDTFPFRKPDPDHITETVKLAGGLPENAIMVGDSINDIQAGQAADIPVIAVDFGYSDVPVADLNPTTVISDFSELSDAVQRIENHR